MSNRLWHIVPAVEPPPAFGQQLGLHPVAAQLAAQRGWHDPAALRAFLDPTAYTPTPADHLPDLALAVQVLAQAIRAQQLIGVWGDFDVDGQTATAALVQAIRALGGTVIYRIPVRASESHGIKVPFLRPFLAQGVRVLLTCDTGITAYEAIDEARAQGVTVLVTDHHTLGEHLPNAHAVVNPQRLPPGHPLRALPGVGVAYKLIEALYAHFGRAEAENYADLAALGIVADVAQQVADTRHLLQCGLERLRRAPRLGLRAMSEAGKFDLASLDEQTIGFQIAPRLNAMGRLADANPMVDLLTTTDLTTARTLAAQLEGMNQKRRELTEQVTQAAIRLIEADPAVLDDWAALVLAERGWPAGIIGIVANRLAERFGKPTVLFALEGDLARGSARSVDGVDITAAIAACAPWLTHFGGHPAAAGLGLPANHVDHFRRALSAAVQAQDPVVGVLTIDLVLPLVDLSLEALQGWQKLAPFGAGNPAPVLAALNLRVQAASVLGAHQQHRRLLVADETDTVHEVLAWNFQGAVPTEPFDLAYTVRLNTYKGERQLQTLWHAARPAERTSGPTLTSAPAEPAIHWVDCRHHPLTAERLAAHQPAVLWAEGGALADLQPQHRWALTPAPTLIVGTAPPDHATWQAVLAHVQPRTVIVYGLLAEVDTAETFLRRLGGLTKFMLTQTPPTAPLTLLAARLAHTPATVRHGLRWWQAQGAWQFTESQAGDITLSTPGTPDPAAASAALAAVHAALAEARAYRQHFLHMPLGEAG